MRGGERRRDTQRETVRASELERERERESFLFQVSVKGPEAFHRVVFVKNGNVQFKPLLCSGLLFELYMAVSSVVGVLKAVCMVIVIIIPLRCSRYSGKRIYYIRSQNPKL